MLIIILHAVQQLPAHPVVRVDVQLGADEHNKIIALQGPVRNKPERLLQLIRRGHSTVRHTFLVGEADALLGYIR